MATKDKVIPLSTLQTTEKPAKVIQPPPATGAEGLRGNIEAMGDAFTQGLTEKRAAAEKDRESSYSMLLDGLASSDTEIDLTNKAYRRDVDPLERELVDINNDIRAEEHGLRRRLEKLDKNEQGLFGGALEDEKDRVTRESLAKQADLAVIQLARQGRFDSAKAIADRFVQAKLEKQTQRNQLLQFMYTENKDMFTLAEQREFESKQGDRERELDFERDKEMARFNQILQQNDPLYKAQVANIYSQIADRNASASAYGTLNGKPQTATQAQVQGYADRTNQSDSIIGKIGAKFTGTSSLLGERLPNLFKSSERQQFEQAQRNFVNAVLRRESGAVISEEEFANAKQQYFPVPGDSTDVLTQKAANRQTVINNLYQQSNTPRSALPGQIIEADDGKTYKVGDDGETLIEL